ncbi:MAG: 30S ribosome-binding factor RbfA [bacterium]|nr:30S ribosome-binding factor RbfA [bacterium]
MANVDRITRVEELIKREVAEVIQDRLRDPRLGSLTITRVKVSRDLGYADVSLMVTGDKKAEKTTLDALNKASGYIRTRIADAIVIKKIPRLRFHPDEEYKKAVRIYELLDEIELDDAE